MLKQWIYKIYNFLLSFHFRAASFSNAPLPMPISASGFRRFLTTQYWVLVLFVCWSIVYIILTYFNRIGTSLDILNCKLCESNKIIEIIVSTYLKLGSYLLHISFLPYVSIYLCLLYYHLRANYQIIILPFLFVYFFQKLFSEFLKLIWNM